MAAKPGFHAGQVKDSNVAVQSKAAGSHTVIDRIGNTPLIRIQRLAAELPQVEIYAKAEYFNPGGSVKDRPALNMIQDGERSGMLTPDKVLIDSTSGNTGIAYAMIAAARGYKVKLFLPANASRERKRILKAYGAETVLTDAGEGSDGAIRECQAEYRRNPEKYFYPDQYGNPANWLAHYETTGPEILAQTENRITHFVTGLGTSGTFTGVGRCFERTFRRHQANLDAAFIGIPRLGRAQAHADRDRACHLR